MSDLLQNKYDYWFALETDISQHLPKLKEYASKVETITEFGVRDVISSWGLLAGYPKKMNSHDFWKSPNVTDVEIAAKEIGCDFTFIMGDVRLIDIEQTDLLFIDTAHTYDQLSQELTRHHMKVNKYIILHDTHSYATIDCSAYLALQRKENPDKIYDKHGLQLAISEFMGKHKEWKKVYEVTFNNGLTVLEKIEQKG